MSAIEGILRVGDMVRLWPGPDVDVGLVLERSGDPREPLPAMFFILDLPDPPFRDVLPADFGERWARDGRISAADGWSTWTEGL